jgi:hypothetical protein
MGSNIRQKGRGNYRKPAAPWLKRLAVRLRKHVAATEKEAKAIGINRPSLFAWLNEASQPKAWDLYLIGKKKEVSIDWLLFGDTVPMMRAERTEIGALEQALRAHVHTALEPYAPSEARSAFVLPGRDYLAEIDKVAIARYEDCLLGLGRGALSYVTWLGERVKAGQEQLPSADGGMGELRRMIDILGSSVRELIFRLTEDRGRYTPGTEAAFTMDELSGIVGGGITTVSWLARFDLERPRSPQEPDSPTVRYKGEAHALTTLEPDILLAVLDPKNLRDFADIKRLAAMLDIKPTRATFRWINRSGVEGVTQPTDG